MNEMLEWYSIPVDTPMGALFGDRPKDNIFNGAITGQTIQASVNDAINAANSSPISLTNDEVLFLVCVHTARRISLEMKGCTIDPDYAKEYFV